MMNRRTLLTSTPAMALAIATPAAAIACSMPIDAGDDSALFALLAKYDAAQADHAKAKADLEWINAEWRHLWPLAPEELLGGTNAHRYVPQGCGGYAERDIAGDFMMREVATLTKRFTSKQRRKGGTNCFTVDASANITERLAYWREAVPRGRTAKSQAKNQKFRLDMLKSLEREHALALAYEGETARLRQVSGADAAISRAAAAENACYNLSEAIMRHPAATMEGIAAKVDMYLILPRVSALFDIDPGWGDGKRGGALAFGWHLSRDIKRLRGKGVVS